jgi:hypothetical protein
MVNNKEKQHFPTKLVKNVGDHRVRKSGKQHAKYFVIFLYNMLLLNGIMWVPVTTAWRVLSLQMEERPPIWRVAVNKLNKQPRQPTRGGPPAWGLGKVITNPLRKKRMLRITHVEMFPLETKQSGGKLLPPSDLRGVGGVFLEEVSRSRKRNRE